MIRAMRRVYLVESQDRQDELVGRLQTLGLLHLEESRLDDASEQPTRFSEKERIENRKRVENLLIKARGICDLFAEVDPALLRSQSRQSYPARLEDLYQAFKAELDSLEGQLKTLVAQRHELQDRRSAGERFAEIVRVSEDILKTLPIENHSVLPAVLAAEQKSALPEIQQALECELPERFSLAHRELSEARVALVLAVDPDYAQSVREYLEAKGIRQLALPPHIEGDFSQGIAQLKAEASAIPQRLREIDEELKALAREDAGRILVLTNALENRLAQLEAAMRFGYTDYTLLISGWVPQDELSRFQATLTREFPGLILQEDPLRVSQEEVPVAFRNSRWSRPYQLFLKVFGTPKHGSIDPVPYMSFFFPIFFGVILGDIGYALLMLALVLWGLRGFPGLKAPGLKKLPQTEMGRSALTVLLQGASFAVFFGIVFGEIFGLAAPWPHFNREEGAIPLLLFTIALGAVQIILGFAFGIVTTWRRGHTKHLLVKIGLFLALFGIALVLGRLMGLVPESLLLPAIVILAIALPLLMIGGGFIALMESLSPFIHVLSYARIMGFGLASVVLAALINDLVGGLQMGGGLLIGSLLAVVIALLFHGINFGLGVFEGTIQSVRLHWVEFFQKFILEELGGVPYKPFQEKRPSVAPEK